MTDTPYDFVLVGGGLQNGLVALALAHHRPDARVALVEAAADVGGNHTWCFHADDVIDGDADVVAPLVVRRWAGYDVAFPGHGRALAATYAAVTSARFREVVRAVFAARGWTLLTGAKAVGVGARRVVLDDGRRLDGRAVIDARGPGRGTPSRAPGYQKFVGLELALHRPHPWHQPTLMDATVPQRDGFRFFYVLPLARDRVLLEDTYYSDTPELDESAVSGEVLAYARARGLDVERVVRAERGVLPLPLRGDDAEPENGGPLVAGYQGGWFHPVTGYSFPVAMRLARHVATHEPEEMLGDDFAALARRQRRQRSFLFRLNRMLFAWYPPAKRVNVLERFYELPEATIRRFYAMSSTAGDRVRILFGRPPPGLSLAAALSPRRAR